MIFQRISVYDFQFGKKILSFSPWVRLSAFRAKFPGLSWNFLPYNKLRLQKPGSFQEVFLKIVTSDSQLRVTSTALQVRSSMTIFSDTFCPAGSH